MNDFEEYKDRGLSGLANIGNTCYLNSCMQVLSHTYELNDYLKDKKYEKYLTDKPECVLLLEWDKLRELMWSQNCSIAPWGFVKAVQKISKLKNKELFSGYSQNDVQEFILFMLDSFHTAISREVDMQITGKAKNNRDELAKACYRMMQDMFSKEYSEIIRLFYGIHVSHIKSKETQETLTFRPEPFFVLSLSIPERGNSTLYDCLHEYCKPETMEGENAWFNEKTNEKQDICRNISFWSLPDILIIDLKRWNMFGRKNNNLIEFPVEDADFTTYVDGYNKETYKYDLYGVCNHMGGTGGGHYTAYVKNANNNWYEFNDISVKNIDEKHIVSNRAYCLFYRKKK
jgi:ubiquitin carboxyl-terminal hydrolase 8